MVFPDFSSAPKASSGFTLPWDKGNLPKQHWINNEFVASKSSKTIEVYNPKDGTLVANDVPVAGQDDVDAAVAAAEAAFPKWKKTLPRQRRDLLNKLADLMVEHQPTLATLTRVTLGMPSGGFGIMEINVAAEAVRYYAGWADKFPGESHMQEDGFMKITRHEPLGVVAAIIPFNAPIAVLCHKIGGALITGNCFIIKPSEKTPFAALALGQLAKEAGFPPGVIQVLTGDGSTGALLASHMRIRGITFTGSAGTGRKVQEASAKSNFKHVTLELGGKSPAMIFDDCNLDIAVAWCVNGITMNSGQACVAASRVYVQEGIYPKFVEAYTAALEARAKTVGDPDESSTQLGPIVDKLQYDRAREFIERAKAQYKLLTGGVDGYFIPPTAFTDVPEDAEIVKTEIFGPVAVINTFKTEEEALAKANDTEYGLFAGVFTQDINKAMRVVAETESGMVGVNCMSYGSINVPFGGSKQSGVGRENGIDGLRGFTEPKTVFINLNY
ncbi:unnamed protein product [Clonostachys solani]|uniref:aldehyde dehydrogenase (NAD(+)) n=1 Tax=Clonostachys solani TaxID=160281 RepID=A0A9N9VZV5_9HYPO|nr:unnamed protein product [Clonostachys solani]